MALSGNREFLSSKGGKINQKCKGKMRQRRKQIRSAFFPPPDGNELASIKYEERATGEIRTPDRLITNQVLYQLSHSGGQAADRPFQHKQSGRILTPATPLSVGFKRVGQPASNRWEECAPIRSSAACSETPFPQLQNSPCNSAGVARLKIHLRLST